MAIAAEAVTLAAGLSRLHGQVGLRIAALITGAVILTVLDRYASRRPRLVACVLLVWGAAGAVSHALHHLAGDRVLAGCAALVGVLSVAALITQQRQVRQSAADLSGPPTVTPSPAAVDEATISSWKLTDGEVRVFRPDRRRIAAGVGATIAIDVVVGTAHVGLGGLLAGATSGVIAFSLVALRTKVTVSTDRALVRESVRRAFEYVKGDTNVTIKPPSGRRSATVILDSRSTGGYWDRPRNVYLGRFPTEDRMPLEHLLVDSLADEPTLRWTGG